MWYKRAFDDTSALEAATLLSIYDKFEFFISAFFSMMNTLVSVRSDAQVSISRVWIRGLGDIMGIDSIGWFGGLHGSVNEGRRVDWLSGKVGIIGEAIHVSR